MQSMGFRTAGVTLLVVLFILISSTAFGFYLSPYEPDSPEYAIAHESTEAFEEILETAELDTDTAVHTDSLSADARTLVEDADVHTGETGEGEAGWHTFEVHVCQDAMLVCDEFAEPPAFPEHGTTDDWRTTVTVVEHESEYFVVERSTSPSADGFVLSLQLYTLFSVVVFSGLLGLVGYKYRDHPTDDIYGMLAVGLAIGLWPYIVMGAGIDSYWWLVIPLTVAGIIAILTQIGRLFKYADSHKGGHS